MQYKNSTKIVIDKRKLETLFRLGCPDSLIISVIKTGTFDKTGDELIDETLECLVDVKDFNNWGGNHNPTGKNQYTKDKVGQVDHRLDGQLVGQEVGQVVDKDKDKDRDRDREYNNKVLIDEYFNFGDYEEVRDIANKYEISVLDRLQKFLVNTFFGQKVDVEFIQKQAERFANGN